jgi:hypothetical protein
MRIVWGYADIQPAMDNVALDAMKGRYNAVEIEVHGKPALWKTGDSVTVTKIYIQVVPIEQAMRDWDKVVASKDVHSPIGTPLARKASSLSLFREFSGNSGTEVLASLRRAVGVVVGTGGIASGGKRKAADQGAGGGSKKAKTDEAMDNI